jgi:hypothetical protein
MIDIDYGSAIDLLDIIACLTFCLWSSVLKVVGLLCLLLAGT